MARSRARPVTLALELQRLRRSGMDLAGACELLAATYPDQAEVLRGIAERERSGQASGESRDSRPVHLAS